MPDESRKREWLDEARQDLTRALIIFDREGELLAAARVAELIDLIDRALDEE